MIHNMLLNQLHPLHAYYMLTGSLVAAAAAAIAASESPRQCDQRARGEQSSLSVGFILPDNIPATAHGVLCEVLAAYR
jgi:hypothetical protein